MKWQHINSGCVDCIFETLESGEERRIAEFYGPDSGKRATLAAEAPALLNCVYKLTQVAEAYVYERGSEVSWAKELILLSRSVVSKAEGTA
jgi:hypothetical protein